MVSYSTYHPTMNAYAKLTELHELAQAGDEDFRACNTVAFTPVTEEELVAVEGRVGSLPPSYRRFVLEHGLFGVGTDPAYDHLSFRLVAMNEIRTVLEELEEQYEETGAAAVADSMGVEESAVAGTAHGIIIAMQGHEDYWVFDTRSRDDDGECIVVGILLEDCEFDYFTEREDYSGFHPFEEFVIDAVGDRIAGD